MGNLPDVIVGGAPRCGTTWLYHLLDSHPDVYMAKPVRPEPKFFLVDELYARGLDYYSDTWFSGSSAGLLVGEKTTNYLESPSAARRIAADLPHVKMVFILREPVSRAISNYFWTRLNGLEHEDLATALDLEEKRQQECPPEHRYSRPYAYFSRGLYCDLLAPYVQLFGLDRICVLKFEDITHRPERLVRELSDFLGIACRPGDATKVDVANAAPYDEQLIGPDTIATLTRRYAEPNRRLVELLCGRFETWEDQS